MNRRTFLKSIATACGAAVVCPGELLKAPVAGIDCGKPVKWESFYKDCNYSQRHKDKLLKEFETAFWNTKFKSPLMKRYETT